MEAQRFPSFGGFLSLGFRFEGVYLKVYLEKKLKRGFYGREVQTV